MNPKLARRSFLAGGSALAVIGFDPVHRSWVTKAFADTPVISLPNLDGVLLTDPASLAAAADDFGHLVHRTPLAVLQPGSVKDVLTAIKFCRRNRIDVAARGQGHSTNGQCQVQSGLVIDTSTLDTIEHIGTDQVHVQAGLLWKDLLATTVPLGLQPPVLTGFVGLSIGGTLSMGGIGAASFRFGAQVDNVIALDVVTGNGDLVTCSPDENPQLFHAVLGGVGQYGIIVRAKLPLEPVLPNARNYVLNYTDADVFFADMNTLTSEGKVDGVYAQIGSDGEGGWAYTINANKFFASASPPVDDDIVAGLTPANSQVTDYDTYSFDTLVDGLIAFLQSIGLTDIPHVWGDLFLPGSKMPTFVQGSLAGLTAADLGPAGFILLFPIRNRYCEANALRLPREDQVFLFDVLTSGLPTDASYGPTETAKTRARFEAARALGGTVYPIGSTPLSKADWAEQYGPIYPVLVRAKKAYDPAGILTPGPGIF